ncbi:MAG: hypothetical protein ACI87O_000933 [Planctomycetota bacterium]|jgi:hypothetical protein
MQLSLLRFVLPAALALMTLAPAEAASPKKADLGITIGSHGELGVRIGTPGFPRAQERHRSRRITPARGYWETITEQVWVQGRVRQEWVSASYDTVYDSCGNRHQVLVRQGYYRTVREPGCYETRSRRVWVPARRGITRGRRGLR